MSPIRRLHARSKELLSPLVHLSNNAISLAGVVLVTTAGLLWLFLLPTMWRGHVDHPYLGIMAFMVLPGLFFGGLLLIPLGSYIKFRRESRMGKYPAKFPPVDLRNVEFRRLVIFVALTTCANLLIGSQLTYRAVTYMDSVTFCGQTCHTVMHPEYAAYQNSPHSRVECVECHIGSGAPWFVRSKLSGVAQVFAVAFNTYPRPIPAPVENLRPARETCETCHWPQKYGEDRLRISRRYAEDEANTESLNVLLLRIGGGRLGPGIHGVHLGEGVHLRYAHRDRQRQEIVWVEWTLPGMEPITFVAPDTDPEEIKRLPVREMDCMDCHNRPTHAFETPDRAMDRAMAARRIPNNLPYVKKVGVEILQRSYASGKEAQLAIATALDTYYRENYPEIFNKRRAEVQRAAEGLLGIFNRNIFPEMRVTWGTYPNNTGHTEFPGCFRCHDDIKAASDGKTITQDCNACHQLLAMEEQNPKILSDLGLASAQ